MNSKEAFEAWFEGNYGGTTSEFDAAASGWDAALEWAASQQEPVAWMSQGGSFKCGTSSRVYCIPLFRHPVPSYPLPDSLYPGSKDWVHSDYAGRVEWLHMMYESKKKEVDFWIDVANKKIPEGITIPRETLQDILGTLTIALPASGFGEMKINQAIAACEALLAAP